MHNKYNEGVKEFIQLIVVLQWVGKDPGTLTETWNDS